MFYVADENERNCTWKEWVWLAIVLLTIIFAVFSCIYGPSVEAPQSMNSSDPYWYSGE